jgi:hypothetical protein
VASVTYEERRHYMKKFVINKGGISEKVVHADYFKIEGNFVWFLTNDSEVVSIKKIDYVDQIDHLA